MNININGKNISEEEYKRMMEQRARQQEQSYKEYQDKEREANERFDCSYCVVAPFRDSINNISFLPQCMLDSSVQNETTCGQMCHSYNNHAIKITEQEVN